MTFDEFYNKYQPIDNELGDEGFLFETYGIELDYVKGVPNNNVWTLVEVDGVLYIIPGFNIVNRLNYLVTKEQWTDSNLEIKYEDDEDN